MSDLRPYPEYKDSGVEWVGSQPRHWAIESVKRSAYVKARVGWKGLTSDEFEDAAHAYLVTGTDFQGKFIDWRNCYQVSRERYEDDPHIQLRNGDLLITKDGTIGKLAVVRDLDKPACLNSGIFVVRPLQSLSSDYLYWVLESTIFRQFVRLTSTGSTILHLYQNVFVQFAFPNPPVEEQQAIASFLNCETAEIDAFIEDQHELIELLHERRAATITQAVTKGLDPNIPMKDSGVEWLGAVPEHWSVTLLKHFMKKVTDGAHISPETEGGVYDFVSTRDLSPEGIDFEGALKTSPATYEYMVRTGCQPVCGDVLFSKDGTVGRTVVVEENRPFVVASSLIIISPHAAKLSSHFLDYLCGSNPVREQVLSYVRGAGLPRLSITNLLKIVGVFPPLSEQQQIANYLARETAEIDAAIADAKQAIVLSKERRAALISAAVTGKIDVRDHQAAKGAA